MARLSFVAFLTLIVCCASFPKTRLQNRRDQSPYLFPFVSRSQWGGREPTIPHTMLGFPVPFVAIHHTYIPRICHTVPDCSSAMRSMQNQHQLVNGWGDIGYTFAVGGEGTVFEGRGWDTVGTHAIGVNSRSVGIALIGDFVSTLPPPVQLQAVKNLIDAGVELGYISPDYKLIGHRAVSATECPGEALYQEIKTWDHYYNGTIEW